MSSQVQCTYLLWLTCKVMDSTSDFLQLCSYYIFELTKNHKLQNNKSERKTIYFKSF